MYFLLFLYLSSYSFVVFVLGLYIAKSTVKSLTTQNITASISPLSTAITPAVISEELSRQLQSTLSHKQSSLPCIYHYINVKVPHPLWLHVVSRYTNLIHLHLWNNLNLCRCCRRLLCFCSWRDEDSPPCFPCTQTQPHYEPACWLHSTLTCRGVLLGNNGRSNRYNFQDLVEKSELQTLK